MDEVTVEHVDGEKNDLKKNEAMNEVEMEDDDNEGFDEVKYEFIDQSDQFRNNVGGKNVIFQL